MFEKIDWLIEKASIEDQKLVLGQKVVMLFAVISLGMQGLFVENEQMHTELWYKSNKNHQFPVSVD